MATAETTPHGTAAKTVRGMDLLDSPLLNKGTAFNDAERTEFGLHGLLPPQVETLEERAACAYEATAGKTTTWNGTSTCAPCKTRMKSCSIGSFSTTLRK